MYEEAGLSTGGQRCCWRNCRGCGTRWCATNDDVRWRKRVRWERDEWRPNDDGGCWQPVKWKPVRREPIERKPITRRWGRRRSDEAVIVGPGGDLVFDPDKLTVTPGTTVKWVWKSDGHNVVPESQPEGAGWKGTGSASELFDTGYTYSHTFSTPGEYAYHCAPHKSAGMTGTITVGSAGGGGAAAEADPEEMGVPFQAHYVGIATILMVMMSLLYTFFFLKYGESAHTSGGNR